MTSKTGNQDTCDSQVTRIPTWGETNAPLCTCVVDVGINHLEQPFVFQLMQPTVLDIIKQGHPLVCVQLQKDGLDHNV